jgi:hypothetical protein
VLSERDLIKPDLRMFQQFLQSLKRTASKATKESASNDNSGSATEVAVLPSVVLGYAGRARSKDAGELTSARTRSVRFASSEAAGEGKRVEYAWRDENFDGDSCVALCLSAAVRPDSGG